MSRAVLKVIMRELKENIIKGEEAKEKEYLLNEIDLWLSTITEDNLNKELNSKVRYIKDISNLTTTIKTEFESVDIDKDVADKASWYVDQLLTLMLLHADVIGYSIVSSIRYKSVTLRILTDKFVVVLRFI
jgi:hypothetical protein